MRDVASDIKERVLAKLKRRKQTQDAFAREVGISAPYLSQILSGKRRPSLTVASKIEQLLGIPARDFDKAA